MGTPAPFDQNVERWMRYAQSPKGRLRDAMTWHNLQKHMERSGRRMRVLDAGCGLADMAAHFFDRAGEIVLLDFSQKMLAEAERRLTKRHPGLVRDRVTFINGRVEALQDCLPPGRFDLILCHTLLEYVPDPAAALAALVGRLAPGGKLSIVTANSFSEAFKLALVNHDLDGARHMLHRKEGTAELFEDSPKKAFDFQEIAAMTAELRLRIEGRYGIRVFADYLPEKTYNDPVQERLLLKLEQEATALAPYLHLARYLQIICLKER